MYNQFEFNQSQNFVGGVDYNFILRNMNFFGETSVSQNGGMATVNGLLMALDKRLSMAIVQRKFDRDFQNTYASAFAERSRPNNESGVYFVSSVRSKIFLTPLNREVNWCFHHCGISIFLSLSPPDVKLASSAWLMC